ncbi:Saccharopine dehydrogenase-domain-containing protein [Dioszegia hungarica]|uniref:Saccharopine dehydrogenase-domain-containing protein n=1 Tax=Dioszegia hungarica TaxID=4972 RepID=A0AA38HFG1_9TREE|nr:Saccharopine dehydrogenase-domain-containing protein [Dioszegia hungarica]KAI9639515.1 Saccharopine dehydrogenase-domain-containing protein [Dioszegia hungarica]
MRLAPRRATAWRRPISSLQRHLTSIGIRKEDPARVWERRTPLTPDAVASLLRDNHAQLEVEVEMCGRRCFPDIDYRHAGAKLVPSLSKEVDLVLGIKEPPVHRIQALQEARPGKKRTYMIFSHTHKGQPYNVPLLSSFLDPHHSQTLIDYELLTRPKKGNPNELKRVAAFGWFAGAVGAGEALSMTGLALLRRGVSTPLLGLPRPYTFPSTAAYKAALRRCGDEIRSTVLTPCGTGPIVIGLTGAGNVSNGAKDMLDAMGVVWVTPEQLVDIHRGTKGMQTQIWACQVPPSAYYEKLDGGAYDRADYKAHPEGYRSVFVKKLAPYITTLINGAGWQEGCPRLMSNTDLAALLAQAPEVGHKLVAVQDIACDLEGGLEFMDRITTIDDPFCVGPGGILISSTDILPTELPADASAYFSSRILPYVQHLVAPKLTTGDVAETIERATIVRDGRLRKQHEWLMPSVDKWRSPSPPAPLGAATTSRRKKRVLLLGSGLVAGPAVEVFSARSDIALGIASNNLQEAQALTKRYGGNVETFSLDVADQVELGRAVSAADVVVSLLPAPMHVAVAQHCIAHGKHLVTASYISPEMKALDEEAKQKDVLLLGECGLDPGIDSMAAMRILSRVKRENKRVTSFVSWCGGLPEPAASNVPFGYKFSWSPKAVLTAAGNDARYKLGGKVEEVKGEDLLKRHYPKVDVWKGLALEGLANRDAMPYADKYGLGEVDGLTNLFRGTLRYQGFSRLLESFRQMGLLSPDPLTRMGDSWGDFLLASLARMSEVSGTSLRAGDVESVLRDLLAKEAEGTMEALRWLSMLPNTATPALPSHLTSPIDILAYILSQKLAYSPKERDSCLLHHAFEIVSSSTPSSTSFGSGETTSKQKVTASLLHYGTPGASSMSVTVGKTLAFAALRVVDGDVKGRGVRGPYEREVWEGVLGSLEEAGVEVLEDWS